METSNPASNVTLAGSAGGPVPGLALRIPGEAYAAPVEFSLSARPVTVSGYDGKVTALSDLITVDNGGAYAASPMTHRRDPRSPFQGHVRHGVLPPATTARSRRCRWSTRRPPR